MKLEFICAFFLLPAMLSAQTLANTNDQITKSRETVITKTVSKVNPAVVGINVTEIREYRDPWSEDPFFRQFFGDQSYKQEVKGLGSGAIISPDGYILTNDHVAGAANKIIVTMTDGTQYDAKMIGSDKFSDVCLLKVEAKNLPHLKFGNSDSILIGEWAIALGNPFGLFEINDKPTVTLGVISATGMNLGQSDGRFYTDMIQTDAAINGGNSGGPLVNGIGELIGMNTLIYTAGSQGNVGVGFAIPINKVKRVMESLKKYGKVDRDFRTGLRIQSIDTGIAKYYKLKNNKGVIITAIQKGSPAEKASLKVGDVITAINSGRINDENAMIAVLQNFTAGETVRLRIKRENEDLTIKLTLEK